MGYPDPISSTNKPKTNEPFVLQGEIADHLGVVNVDAAIASFTDGTDYFDAETPNPVGAIAAYTVGAGAKWNAVIVEGIILGNEQNVLEIACSNSPITTSTLFDAVPVAQRVYVVTEDLIDGAQSGRQVRVNLPGNFRYLAMQQAADSTENDVNVAARITAIRHSSHYGGVNNEDILDTPSLVANPS